jgi:energy-coupling factor transport system permease protein
LRAGSVSRFLLAVSIALGSAMADSISVILMMILGGAVGAVFWGGGTRDLMRILRTAGWFVAFVFVLHLFSHPGEKIFSILFLNATFEGVADGLFYGLKLVAFACSAGIVLLAVDPFELILPIERACRLFGSFGKRLASIAMALSLALRFLPDLSTDSRTTLMAYQTRGIGFEGGLIRRGRVAVQLLATVFVNAFKRAGTVSTALDIKGYSTRYAKAVFPAPGFSISGTLVVVLSLAFILWGWLA